jgi:glycosyltransferase involved in cell wall biosynthesis
MRVVMVLESPWWGGLEKVFVDLANHIATRCVVSVLVASGSPYLDRFTDQVGSVGILPAGSRRNPRTLLKLRRVLADLRPDVVHSHGPKAAEMVHWAGLRSSFTHVATKHNTRRSPIFSRVRWVTAVSKQARESVSNRHGVEVVYNGIEPRLLGRVDKPGAFTIVSVGRLHGHKGFDILIRAAQRLDFEYAVEIVGEGPERPLLEALVSDLGLQNRVRLLGHREDVPEILSRAHLQVISSRTEGFSLALLEGIHYSDVVLATPVGLAPEVLPPELLLDPARVAESIGSVHARYDDYVTHFAGVKEAQHDAFRLPAVVDEYLAVYQHAREGRASPSE